MAALKRRLNQKGTDGSYHAVHLETEAALVIMSDGSTLQAKLNDLQNKVLTTIPIVPFQKAALTYTGDPQTPEWAGYDPSCMDISGTTSAIDAGEYIVTFTAKKGYQWSDESSIKTVVWKIDHITIAEIPSQSGSLVYTGNAQTPAWSNYDTTMLNISGDTSGVNAGTYVTIFTPRANYKWADGTRDSKTVEWSLNRAPNTITLSEASVKIDTAGYSRHIVATRKGAGIISVVSSDENVATCSIVDDVITVADGGTNGSCTITVNVEEATNYNSATVDITVIRDVYECPVPATPGAECTWAGHDWIVCHVTDTQIVLAHAVIYSKTPFGSSQVYAGSTLASVAKQFENSIDKSLLAQAMDTTVNGVTAKIFVASKEQMNGGFSWFRPKANRVCKYNGSAEWYWTSSPYVENDGDPNCAWFVHHTGEVYRSSSGTYLPDHGGFRPFVAIKR